MSQEIRPGAGFKSGDLIKEKFDMHHRTTLVQQYQYWSVHSGDMCLPDKPEPTQDALCVVHRTAVDQRGSEVGQRIS